MSSLWLGMMITVYMTKMVLKSKKHTACGGFTNTSIPSPVLLFYFDRPAQTTDWFSTQGHPFISTYHWIQNQQLSTSIENHYDFHNYSSIFPRVALYSQSYHISEDSQGYLQLLSALQKCSLCSAVTAHTINARSFKCSWEAYSITF